MSVKKLEQQKKQAEIHLAGLNQQLVAGIRPKLEETVGLLKAHQDIVSKDQSIQKLVMEAVKIVYGDDFETDVIQLRNKRAHGTEITLTFDWQQLTKVFIDAGATSAEKGLTKRELEKLYFGDVGIKFEHNKWSDKDSKANWLMTDLDSPPKLRRYWVTPKLTNK